MKTIWVYENIREDKSFYSKFNILLLLSSVRLWKKNHPNFPCFLYCDKLTYNLLKDINVLKLWDEVILYSHDLNINRKVFWACNKVNVLNKQTEPCIILDHDSLVYKPIDEYLNDEVLVAHLELGEGYYPTNYDENIRNLSYNYHWETNSVNVSFLYFPKIDFLKTYTSLSLKIMEEFTNMNVPNSQYLIFSEQLLLKHLLDKHKVKYKSLITNYWDCNKWDWGESHSKGIWKYPESNLYYQHYGPLKNVIINDSNRYKESEECQQY